MFDWGEEEGPFGQIKNQQSEFINRHSNRESGFVAAGWLFRGGRGGRGWNGVEAEFFGWRSGSGDELFDGFEDELELLVVVSVFFLEGFDFLGQEGVGIHQPPELHEGPHDGDVHLHGTFRPQHAGKHGDTLLGEGVGEVLAVLAAL
jgi:hypothetical protein